MNLLIILFSFTIYILLFLQHSNKKELRLITEKYADELMKSNQPSSIDIVIERYLTFDIKYNNYAVFIIEPDATYLATTSDKQRDFIYEEYKEIVKNYFKGMEFPNVVTLQLKGFISIIINYNEITDLDAFIMNLFIELKKLAIVPLIFSIRLLIIIGTRHLMLT